MNLKKRMLALTAILALVGSSLMAIGTSVAAQQIESSITVLETGCVDDPTTLQLSVSMNPTWDPDTAGPSAWVGTGGNTEGARLNMDVSECAGGWTVNATVTDFTSEEGNVMPASNRFYLTVTSYNGRAIQLQYGCNQWGCTDFPTELSSTWGPRGNITGPGAYGDHVYFGGAGPEYTTQTSHPLLSGNAAAVGPMYGTWGVRWNNLYTIRDTPPGEYSATLKMTFTPANP